DQPVEIGHHFVGATANAVWRAVRGDEFGTERLAPCQRRNYARFEQPRLTSFTKQAIYRSSGFLRFVKGESLRKAAGPDQHGKLLDGAEGFGCDGAKFGGPAPCMTSSPNVQAFLRHNIFLFSDVTLSWNAASHGRSPCPWIRHRQSGG